VDETATAAASAAAISAAAAAAKTSDSSSTTSGNKTPTTPSSNHDGAGKSAAPAATATGIDHHGNAAGAGGGAAGPVATRRNRKKKMTDEEFYGELKSLLTFGAYEDSYSLENKKLGSGASGTVKLARDRKTRKLVAIKFMQLAKQPKRDMILTEIAVMKKLQHKNIVNYIQSYCVNQRSESAELLVVMEYLDGGSLTDVATETMMQEPIIAAVTRECLEALEFLHEHYVIHRDVKSDNVLLGMDGEVKLTDFGFCAQLGDHSSTRQTMVGTPYWMAPEVVNRTVSYNNKIDVWSLAIYLIQTKGKPDYKDPDNMSAEMKDFLDKCLSVDIAKRPTPTELLSHQFLKKACPLTKLKDYILAARKWSADCRLGCRGQDQQPGRGRCGEPRCPRRRRRDGGDSRSADNRLGAPFACKQKKSLCFFLALNETCLSGLDLISRSELLACLGRQSRPHLAAASSENTLEAGDGHASIGLLLDIIRPNRKLPISIFATRCDLLYLRYCGQVAEGVEFPLELGIERHAEDVLQLVAVHRSGPGGQRQLLGPPVSVIIGEVHCRALEASVAGQIVECVEHVLAGPVLEAELLRGHLVFEGHGVHQPVVDVVAEGEVLRDQVVGVVLECLRPGARWNSLARAYMIQNTPSSFMTPAGDGGAGC
uniref:non-specific serine/threonine protein kinase n=1 Tax=Macrostomum lignano TaxID=282301 RepID=A0A1I8ILC7_9PLAT